MIAVDTNLLVYAHREDSEWHEPAFESVRLLAEGAAPWAIPWPCVHEFLAVVTHPRIYSPPTPLKRAIEQVDAWLESPSLRMISEDNGYWETLRRTLISSRISGPAIHDSRIAALCIRWGVKELWSADRDFSRVAALRVANPLASKEGPAQK